ncbi:hypothetical protein IGI39_004687 [Enterococcus sp. AZ135]|uniref:CPBP family glutamic-type intramembrane protease n=1 Tax=unclassified Enterococcus TaxID=2608891 RepID=UPI003F26678C
MTNKSINQIIGLTVMLIGFYLMTNVNLHIGLFQQDTLFIACLIGLPLIFSKQGLKKLFSAPKKGTWKWIPIIFAVNMVLSALIDLFLKSIGIHTAPNSVTNTMTPLLLILIPFALLAEEMISISIFEIVNQKANIIISSLVTAIAFGLFHFSTYTNGNVVETLAHVLLIQGVSRLLFNYVYIKCGRSLIASWICHMLVDYLIFITVAVLGLFL